MLNKIIAYLNISRQELRGFIVLFLIFIILYFVPFFYDKFNTQPLSISIEELKYNTDEIALNSKSNKLEFKEETDFNIKKLHPFNPNNLPLEEWIELGLSPKQAHVIKNFEAKGGKFYKKEDLKKIYGIAEKQYLLLEPYISIPQNSNLKYPETTTTVKATSSKIMVNINSSDSLTLQLIKGIGPTFASRIVKYRGKIGGFVNKEQLTEVFGIDSVKFEQIKDQINIDTQFVSFIHINKASDQDFSVIPYLSLKQKRVLLAYKKQHGGFKDIKEIQKAILLDEQTLNKITPYIKF